MSPPGESKQPPGKAAAAKTNALGQEPFYADGVTSLVACGRTGDGLLDACDGVAQLWESDVPTSGLLTGEHCTTPGVGAHETRHDDGVDS